MKRVTCSSAGARRTSHALVCAAVLTLLGCDNDVNVSPTSPRLPNPTPGSQILRISGTLMTERGSCLEATVLYDGKELSGAHAWCPDTDGCAKLDLSATTRSASGRHTISFRVLRQSSKAVDYRADGTVLVSREGLPLGGVSLNLGSKRARLRAGESVTFDVHLVY